MPANENFNIYYVNLPSSCDPSLSKWPSFRNCDYKNVTTLKSNCKIDSFTSDCSFDSLSGSMVSLALERTSFEFIPRYYPEVNSNNIIHEIFPQPENVQIGKSNQNRNKMTTTNSNDHFFQQENIEAIVAENSEKPKEYSININEVSNYNCQNEWSETDQIKNHMRSLQDKSTQYKSPVCTLSKGTQYYEDDLRQRNRLLQPICGQNKSHTETKFPPNPLLLQMKRHFMTTCSKKHYLYEDPTENKYQAADCSPVFYNNQTTNVLEKILVPISRSETSHCQNDFSKKEKMPKNVQSQPSIATSKCHQLINEIHSSAKPKHETNKTTSDYKAKSTLYQAQLNNDDVQEDDDSYTSIRKALGVNEIYEESNILSSSFYKGKTTLTSDTKQIQSLRENHWNQHLVSNSSSKVSTDFGNNQLLSCSLYDSKYWDDDDEESLNHANLTSLPGNTLYKRADHCCSKIKRHHRECEGHNPSSFAFPHKKHCIEFLDDNESLTKLFNSVKGSKNYRSRK